MRKLVLSALFVIAAGLGLHAQKLSDVQKKVSENKFQEAKADIDKILADAKGQKDANAWYWKSVVYNGLAKDTTKDNSAFRNDAFDAYVKMQEMDAKNVMGTLEQNVTLFDLHGQYLRDAYSQHNNKNYEQALQNYKNAFKVQSYINTKNFNYNGQTLPAVDTMTAYYAGSAALLAKDTASAIQFFENVASTNVKDKDFLYVYQTLVDYYNKKGDKAKTDQYIALGQKLYPDNEYWVYFELQDPSIKNDKAKMLAKYEELMAKHPQNSGLQLDYAIEMFNFTYGQDKPADYTAAQAKLENAIKKTLSTNNSAEANYLMVQHMSNKIYDVQEANRAIAKSTKPADIEKRKQYAAQINKLYDESVTYAEAAAKQFEERKELKNVEKANYRSILNQLKSYYTNKKQLDKAQEYDNKLKQLG